ncbi:MAG: UDP-N-acetylmuramoyl-L-alanine--D-glutamate ligase [Anaerolineaceae bacterium]|nr:UDP-N-acetylmuramoyl-L-alanine--D-glutamate ligase [Anaerolineaceae bacterium]
MHNWTGKRVLIIGAARQGIATARHLIRQGAEVTLNDRRSVGELQAAREALADLPARWITDEHPLSLIDSADLVCVSGGVPLTLPLIEAARQRGLPLTNDSQIFMDAVTCPVVGITGSAGKTTTTALVGRMAEFAVQAPRRVWVGGNIGVPLIDRVEEISPADLVILEFSSFQLELMTSSPNIAAVLNVTPNHLDRHLSFEAYLAAKTRILTFQGAEDIAVLGADDPAAWGLAPQVRGRLISFSIHRPPLSQTGVYTRHGMVCLQERGSEQSLFPVGRIHLRGDHNRLNVLAACAIAHAAGLTPEAMQKAVDSFEGVPHRLEYIRSWKGADWYNDSIATAPERTLAAIRAFDQPLVLLLGGRDKDLPWEGLADMIRQRVDHVIAFGECAAKIVSTIGALHPGMRPYTLERCDGLQQAVQAAAQVTSEGDVVLLSPGGTSYDEFLDFEERGKRFREWVHELS